LILNNALGNAKIDELFRVGIEVSPEEGDPTESFGYFYALEWHFVLIIFSENFEYLLNLTPHFYTVIFHSISNMIGK
jgi:hypothetical protein